MRRTTKKKTIAATAFLLFLLIIAFLVPHFLGNLVDACGRHKPPHHHLRPPPLGKFIHITFTCSQTGKPIVGLPVTIGDVTIKTNEKGEVVFGSGYGAGTYTYTFEWWDGLHSKTVTIDCTKKDWFYTETLVNPEVHKTFLIDTENNNYPPVVGLDVTLVGYGTKTTDENGYVEWVLDYPFGDYTLEWTWNSVPASEPVYWKDFVDGVWKQTNKLEPKSGGGK